MNLAKKFTFTHELDYREAPLFYTAEQDADGSYIITWEWDSPLNQFGEKRCDPFTTYDAEDVESLIKDGIWRVKEVIIGPEAPYEPKTEVIESAWPYTVCCEPLTDWQHPALVDTNLLSSSIISDEPVVDYGITLLHIQKFCEDTGYTVEVDEDLISFVYDGKAEYVVSSQEDMAAVMQAIRTLERFRDRG